MTTYMKERIEMALPLEDINRAAASEKSIQLGYPFTAHSWWSLEIPARLKELEPLDRI